MWSCTQHSHRRPDVANFSVFSLKIEQIGFVRVGTPIGASIMDNKWNEAVLKGIKSSRSHASRR